MGVDEARRDEQAAAVDSLEPVRVTADASVTDDEVPDPVDPGGRIEHPGAGDDERCRLARALHEARAHAATASASSIASATDAGSASRS